MTADCLLFGLKINPFKDYDQFYGSIVKLLSESKTGFITVNNVHTIVEGVTYTNFKKVINSSAISVADGKPLSLYIKVKYCQENSRIFGPTLLERTLDLGQKDHIKHFFFGSSAETLKKMLNEISRKYPSSEVCGHYSPPYKKNFTAEENNSYLALMNESEADIVWIGLGAPKQELWIYENHKKLNKGIMVGIGAGFDYLAGNIKHAPEWMKNASLEWLYRLIQDPGRLWKRYLVTNTLFIVFVILEFLRLKKFE